MRLRWIIPIAFLLPLRLAATEPVVAAHVATMTINPAEVTTLHLRPEFESIIRMPEEVTSVILGSPGSFKAEHNEGEPQYVYVKPITKEPAQTNLLIATKSGLHVTLELVSDGTANATAPVDFLIEYRTSHSFLVGVDPATFPAAKPPVAVEDRTPKSGLPATGHGSAWMGGSALDVEYEQQLRINSPAWTKWDGQQIETSIGDVRQWSNETVVSYSIFNASGQPVEVVPPQIQITGHKTAKKKKKKEGKDILSDQLLVREYRQSATRLEPGGRADGVVVFDRPNFKESTERLFLQFAQADQVDRPILIRIPFTPPIAAESH
jgi:hypothetical protein